MAAGSEAGESSLASEASRTHCQALGKHVGCVAVSSDWVACGGGPLPGLRHFRTLSLLVTLTSEVTAEVGVSASTTYSLEVGEAGGGDVTLPL